MSASETGGNGSNGSGFGKSRPIDKKPIGEMLVDAGLIERAQLDEALQVQARRGGKLVQILITLGFFEPTSFVHFLARQPGVASIDLSNYEVPKELVALVPKEFAIRHEVFPIDRLGKLLTLGMVCPLDSTVIGELEAATGLRVKPLLCGAEDIRRAINRYYPHDAREEVVEEAVAPDEKLARLETSLRLGNVVTLVRQIETLPTLPETVARVREAIDNPDCSMEDLASIIATDPPIAAKVLSVANSAAYGFPNRIDSLRLAVSMLGLRELYGLVLSAAVIKRSEEGPRRFNYQRFWSHSTACAAACKVVAAATGNGRLNSVPTAGLLHDLGVMALLEVAPDVYAKIDQNLWGEELIATEQRVLGISHAEAGYELAQRWGLPRDIAEVIRFHHQPEYAADAAQIVSIVALGDILYRLIDPGQPVSPETFVPYEARLAALGLAPDDGVQLAQTYVEQRVMDARSGRVW